MSERKPGGDGSGASSYRSAMELQLVGINFKPSNNDSTESSLLNTVAYEACADSPDDFAVTSYICLLDSLIDHAEDVKELRSKGILHSFLGSDEQVADLFNKIANNLVPNADIYRSIRENIESITRTRS
ncbi:hypothetical protein OWV82_019944 [Melia azedarach]|uniref:Uncharacterized protein n=1 Tax=Melia azedarach TaxID=155640 RepID=A0ACC1X4Z7_MELAZ|nr:hypothetical protein OWV82_019944 [Melia azedarach]